MDITRDTENINESEAVEETVETNTEEIVADETVNDEASVEEAEETVEEDEELPMEDIDDEELPVDDAEDDGLVDTEEPNVPSISAGTITRTVLLFLSLINLVLGAFGMSPLPIDSEQLNALISSALTVIMAIITWWKDNDITEKARARKAKIMG